MAGNTAGTGGALFGPVTARDSILDGGWSGTITSLGHKPRLGDELRADGARGSDQRGAYARRARRERRADVDARVAGPEPRDRQERRDLSGDRPEEKAFPTVQPPGLYQEAGATLRPLSDMKTGAREAAEFGRDAPSSIPQLVRDVGYLDEPAVKFERAGCRIRFVLQTANRSSREGNDGNEPR